MKARLVEGTEVLVEGGKVMGRQTKEEGVRLLAEVIGQLGRRSTQHCYCFQACN